MKRFPVSRLLLAATLAGLFACEDARNPTDAPAPSSAAQPSHRLQWNPGPSTSRMLRVVGGSLTTPGAQVRRRTLIEPSVIAGPTPSPASATFWAYTNQASSVEIDYLAADSTWLPYVSLNVPAGALLKRPDGSFFGLVDSTQVTVTVDSSQVLVTLDPTGLRFNPLVPATLKIWYGGSNPDFNSDGVVNWLDNLIEQNLLHVWCQEDVLDPWRLVSAVHNLLDKSFTVPLGHFSGYAVSW
ncbi:MAG TPA: hypothetical protein VGI83_04405 [Gemmatimonadales bacterium]|jgi:hypothetical protein